jgi:hypothetical protein
MVAFAEREFGVKLPGEYIALLQLQNGGYMTEEWGLPPRQVLLSGDGHWWITLDYRRSDVPTVAWIDVECGQDLQIAPSFAAFLAGLRPAADFE